MTNPMSFIWRTVFWFAIAIGLFAVGYGALALAGVSGVEGTTTEAAVTITFGLLVQPFAWTGLRHARLRLTDDELEYLSLGFVCSTARLLP